MMYLGDFVVLVPYFCSEFKSPSNKHAYHLISMRWFHTKITVLCMHTVACRCLF